MLADYHLHSSYSFDGKQTLEELCEAALRQGLDEIAVTEHMDLFRGKPYRYILNCEESFRELEKVRKRYQGVLTIRRGIELGQPMRNPEEAEAFLRDWPLDFVIGSLHNMEHDIDVGTYRYDQVDWDVFFPHYLEWLKDLAENYDYDVLGHVTYPMRYLYLQTKRELSPMAWKDAFSEIFRIVIARGKGIELNTSSIARGTGPLMPTEELLVLYRELGGEIITTGSDAHVKEQTGKTARMGQGILRKAGFSYFSTFENRHPVMHPL